MDLLRGLLALAWILLVFAVMFPIHMIFFLIWLLFEFWVWQLDLRIRFLDWRSDKVAEWVCWRLRKMRSRLLWVTKTRDRLP